MNIFLRTMPKTSITPHSLLFRRQISRVDTHPERHTPQLLKKKRITVARNKFLNTFLKFSISQPIILFGIRFYSLSTISVDNFVNKCAIEGLTKHYVKVFLKLINNSTLNLKHSFHRVTLFHLPNWLIVSRRGSNRDKLWIILNVKRESRNNSRVYLNQIANEIFMALREFRNYSACILSENL